VSSRGSGGDARRAIPLKERALAIFRSLDHERWVAATLHDLADTWAHIGDYERAREAALEALEIRRRIGLPGGIAHAMSSLADVELFEGNYDEALRLYEEIVEIARRPGRRRGDLIIALHSLAECLRRREELPRAASTLREAITRARETKIRFGAGEMLYTAAALIADAKPHRGAILIGGADAVRLHTGFDPWDAAEEQRTVQTLKHALGEATFAELRAEGATLSADAALINALDSLPPSVPTGKSDSDLG
jgi:tetratricopeptide (TPR) repeat protein